MNTNEDKTCKDNANTTSTTTTTTTYTNSIQNYEKLLPKIAFASFTLGLASVFFYNRKGNKGGFLARYKKLPAKNVDTYNPHTKLATKFSSQPIEEARMFALKTFGLGTLLCTTVMGTLTLSVAYMSGCKNLKEFSQFMRLLIGKQILNKDLKDIPTYEDEDNSLKELYVELEQDESK